MASGGARPGAGRKPGAVNKVTADIKALAQQHAAAAIGELARLAVEAQSEPARVSAIKELLDRGFGKATQAVDLSADVKIGAAPAFADLLRLMGRTPRNG